jgi:hypothetical protein
VRISRFSVSANEGKDNRLRQYALRAKEITNEFRKLLYRSVCMSLFEKHKLLFAFFIALKVFEKDKSFEQGLIRLNKMG